jgi:Zn-dependent protease with chaperone function
MLEFVYPPMPEGVDEKVVQPSAAFKQEVFKVTGSIIFFLVTYFFLLTAAVGLAGLCAYGGFSLVIAFPQFITLMIGLGLAGLGLMVIFFLLKFIFKRTKTDRSNLIEITEAEQPDLFSFIRRLTLETQAPFPKKIFLSNEVNASVFYNSSFWSMFLPVQKNLQIGLGLVNTLNISEFKAVLAHEFGHFSQRSMKLGSYVYNVNQVIYNMLYDNDGYSQVLQKWANASGFFSFFARLTIKIVLVIQWLLQKVYALVNRSYLGLSRQMEFHADAVAAYVTGSDHLVTALRRVEVAAVCYNHLLSLYDSWLPASLKPTNLYPHHRLVMHHFATDNNIPVAYGLPLVTAQAMAFFNQSRIVVKDQWASHPSTADREAYLNALNLKTPVMHEPAWGLFRNVPQLQEQLTQQLFEQVDFGDTPALLDEEKFKIKFAQEIADNSFNKVYKGFYDNRRLTEFSPATVATDSEQLPAQTLDTLLPDNLANLPARISGLKADIATIRQIASGQTEVKTFDFDGQKFEQHEAGKVVAALESELAQLETQLARLDKQLFRFFYHKAQEKGMGHEITQAYTKLFAVIKETDTDLARYNKIIEELSRIFTSNLTLEQAQAVINEVKIYENGVKERLTQILAAPAFSPFYTPRQQARLNQFIIQDITYFDGFGFNHEAISELTEILHVYVTVTGERCFRLKKELLAQQLTFVD